MRSRTRRCCLATLVLLWGCGLDTRFQASGAGRERDMLRRRKKLGRIQLRVRPAFVTHSGETLIQIDSGDCLQLGNDRCQIACAGPGVIGDHRTRPRVRLYRLPAKPQMVSRRSRSNANAGHGSPLVCHFYRLQENFDGTAGGGERLIGSDGMHRSLRSPCARHVASA
jgi:hypothetical protein